MTSQTAPIESPLIRYCRWSLAIVAAAMPSYVARFGVRPIRTDLLEILVLLTIALYIGGQLRTWSAWRPVRSGIEIPTALLLLAGLISIAVSTDHFGAIGFYRAYFIEPIVLFYVAIDLMRRPNDFRIVLVGFAVGTSIFAVLNYGAWVIALKNHVDINLGNAPEALYTSPNSVAIFMEPAVAIAAGFVLYSDDRRDRTLALIWLVFGLGSMLATLSRAGMLTLVVLVFVAVVTMRRTRLKLAILGTAVLAAVAVLQIPFVSKRLYRQFDPSYPRTTYFLRCGWSLASSASSHLSCSSARSCGGVGRPTRGQPVWPSLCCGAARRPSSRSPSTACSTRRTSTTTSQLSSGLWPPSRSPLSRSS